MSGQTQEFPHALPTELHASNGVMAGLEPAHAFYMGRSWHSDRTKLAAPGGLEPPPVLPAHWVQARGNTIMRWSLKMAEGRGVEPLLVLPRLLLSKQAHYQALSALLQNSYSGRFVRASKHLAQVQLMQLS